MNLENLLVSSDYGIDKVCFVDEGEINFPDQNQFQSKYLPTGEDSPILLFGCFSLDPDFKQVYGLGQQVSVGSTAWDTATVLGIWVDGTVTMRGVFPGNRARKLYYRVCGISGEDKLFQKTEEKSGNFVLNTDYNYIKLIKSGWVSGRNNETIHHGLGRIPFCVWWEESGSRDNRPWHIFYYGHEVLVGDRYSNAYFWTDENNLYFSYDRNQRVPASYYYRIYSI